MQSPHHHVRDRIAGAVGLVGAALLVWAVLSSMSGYPHYSPLRHFISQLADPLNPYAGRLGNAFMIGGALIAGSMMTWSATATSGAATWAARLAAGAAASLVFVGVFDITAPAPHVAFAAATGALGMAACVSLARAMGHVARAASAPTSMRRIARLIRVLVAVQLASLVASLAYLAVVVARARPGSFDALFRLPPRVVWMRIGGEYVNPLCIGEWLLFAISTALLLMVSAHLLLRSR